MFSGTRPYLKFWHGAVLAAVLWSQVRAVEPGDSLRAIEQDAAAAAAQARADLPEFLARAGEAAALRPDVPRLLMKLAAAQVANDEVEAALESLGRIVAMGVSMPVADDPAFQALQGSPAFEAVVKQLAANTRPAGPGKTAFALREVTGLIEGIAWRKKTGDFLFGDVNARAVWLRSEDGTLRRLTADSEDLLGVHGLALDEEADTLWAATSAVPAMRGYTGDQEGLAALVEIDPDSGKIRRSIPLTGGSGSAGLPMLGDVAVAPDRSVYASGSATGIVWRLAPGGSQLERWAEAPDMMTLEGIAITAGGRALLVADRMNGLFRIEFADPQPQWLGLPENSTLVGLDGLATAPGGSVIAIQNGTSPNRILEFEIDPGAHAIARVRVLEAGHFTMAAPAHGCMGPGGRFHFVGNSGWQRFDTSNEPSEPRSVPIFSTAAGAGSH